MARKIHSTEIDNDGESVTFRYRKPSGAFMLAQSDQVKDGKISNDASTRALFAECLVDDTGAPLGKAELAEVLDMPWEVTQALQKALIPAAKDEVKNA